MTVKRRLYISNSLMIALPMIITAISFIAVAHIFWGASHTELEKGRVVRFATQEEAKAYLESGELAPLQVEFLLYQAQDGTFLVVGPEGMRPYVGSSKLDANNFLVALSSLFMLLALVYVTNRYLTRFIFNSIVTPLDALTKGVHEIGDGNLDYRIQYDKNDEFRPICKDFNEMAGRISDMVAQQQKDEQNRRELIAGMSHDLRTPLTSIKAYIEGLEKGVAVNPRMRTKYLETIKKKTGDLEYIINQLFLFSKLDIGEYPFHMESTDIGDELQAMAEGFSEEYRRRGLEVSLKENVSGIRCMLDAVQFHNVVQNILDNSVKYAAAQHAHAEITCTADEDTVYITVADNGPGAPEASLEKLFDVFYRSDTSRSKPESGSGLGLAIAAKIIGRHGGQISAQNLPEGGLCIRMALPIDKEGGESDETNPHH